MAFNPSSTIYLCKVPFDSTYKHQVWFFSNSKQQEYFTSKVVKTFTEYLPVRKTLPNGGFQSAVRVGANIDELQNCNYMYYQNANHGTKFFYCFIEKFIYINENTTEIIFETDVYQTWRGEVNIKPSYVVREHSNTDEIGDNITPEKFNFADYDYKLVNMSFSNEKMNLNSGTRGILVGSSKMWKGDTAYGQIYTGNYQGVAFYYFRNITEVNKFVEEMVSDGYDDILFMIDIPEFLVDGATLTHPTNQTTENGGYISSKATATKGSSTTTFNESSVSFDGFKPINKKLYTNPFCNLIVTNHSGNEAVYNLEDFSNGVEFEMVGDLCSSPSITLYPKNYKGIGSNIDCGITINDFTHCAFNIDSYKLWLARNKGTMLIDTVSNIGSIASGIGMVATGGAGLSMGLGAVMSGASGLMQTLNASYQAEKEPNKYHAGSPKSSLLNAMGKHDFDYYYRTIKRHFAESVDDFFTMYGYQTNRVKYPNVTEPWLRDFYYTETIDVNISGNIPNEDMKVLKAMFNNGVTFWRDSAKMYDYTIDNSPRT